MTSNKNSNNFNNHPEMNDGYSFFNNEIPKTIQQLLSMQGSNSKKINTESITSLNDMPYVRIFLENTKDLINRSIKKGVNKINENMNLLDDLKIIESKRLNKMKFINEHLVSEEIEELIKDRFYLEKLIDLMKNIDNDLQSFIYKFAELEKITNNLETEFEV